MKDLIISFLNMTAVQTEAPKLFGAFHIAAALITAAAAVCAAFFCARRIRSAARSTTAPAYDRTALIKILSVCGWVLVILEVYKQLFLYHIVNGGAYDWWFFPFQLCSVPMYLCLFLPLWKGRMKDTVLLYLWDFCFFGALLALLYPEAILRAPLPLRIHGFLWHALLLFIAFLILFAAKCRDDARAFFRTALLFLFFCLLATGVNLLLEGQGLPGSYPDMFYLTPYHPATQPVAREAEVLLGRLPARILYVLALLLLGVLDHLFFRTVRKH